MKKRNLNALKLNKKSISNLQFGTVVGGNNSLDQCISVEFGCPSWDISCVSRDIPICDSQNICPETPERPKNIQR